MCKKLSTECSSACPAFQACQNRLARLNERLIGTTGEEVSPAFDLRFTAVPAMRSKPELKLVVTV